MGLLDVFEKGLKLPDLRSMNRVRIHLAEEHHRAARIKLPNVETLAVFHAIVEHQIG